MKTHLMLILVAAVMLTACGPEKGMEIHEVWMRPTAQGENAAVYFVIHNHSSKADELVGVSSDSAEAVEMHETKMSGDVMQMSQVRSVPLEPYAEIDFAPGKYHVMLVRLKKDLNVGDQIQITLHFKNFKDTTVNVPVRDTPAPEEDHSSTNHS